MRISVKGSKASSAGPGFTLVEMLVVIIVLSVITAISVSSMQGMKNNERAVSAQNNAKMILQIYAKAVKAGANESADGFTGLATKNEILEALHDGVSGSGDDADKHFQISAFDPASQKEAEAFLEYDPASRILRFNPEGVLP